MSWSHAAAVPNERARYAFTQLSDCRCEKAVIQVNEWLSARAALSGVILTSSGRSQGFESSRVNGAKKHSERKRFWTHGLPGQHKEEQNACEDEDPRKREHSSYRAFRCTPGVIAVVGSRDREELGFHFQGMPPIGQLTFTVMGAERLKDVERFGKQDPYCVISLGTNRCRTKTSTDGGTFPKWGETMQFTTTGTETEIQVSIFNENTLMKDELIGATRIPLQTVYDSGYEQVQTVIDNVGGKSQGLFRAMLGFKVDPNAVQMAPQAAGGYGGAFGQPHQPPQQPLQQPARVSGTTVSDPYGAPQQPAAGPGYAPPSQPQRPLPTGAPAGPPPSGPVYEPVLPSSDGYYAPAQGYSYPSSAPGYPPSYPSPAYGSAPYGQAPQVYGAPPQGYPSYHAAPPQQQGYGAPAPQYPPPPQGYPTY